MKNIKNLRKNFCEFQHWDSTKSFLLQQTTYSHIKNLLTLRAADLMNSGVQHLVVEDSQNKIEHH